MYDGPFGVIAGILAAEHFSRDKRLPFGIDVLAFGDEEGSRFPATLSSSSACAGIFEPENLELADRNGVTLARCASRPTARSPDDIAAAAYARDEAAAYVEVHIEQGPVLEARKQPLGVVTAIIGQTYLNVEFLGEAGHAGTVPMLLRRDALAGAAEAMLLGETLAREHQRRGWSRRSAASRSRPAPPT